MKISELPEGIKEKALEYQKDSLGYDKNTDSLDNAFEWAETDEDDDYWDEWYHKKPPKPESLIHTFSNEIKEEYKEIESPKHYDNTNGSLYQFCEKQGLNAYEFDIIKRVMRCRKKGNFIEDLEKTKYLIDLYILEQKSLN